MARLGVEQLEGGDAVGCSVDGVMSRFAEEPVLWVLEALEGIDPGAALLAATRQRPEGIEEIDGIGAAVGVEAEVARTRRVRPRPTGVCTGRTKRVSRDERCHRIEERLEIAGGFGRTGHAARG
jgi:hypothetical protein